MSIEVQIITSRRAAARPAAPSLPDPYWVCAAYVDPAEIAWLWFDCAADLLAGLRLKAPAGAAPAEPGQGWFLKLYLAGQTPKSVTALSNLLAIRDTHLKGRFDIEVIDLLAQPQLASRDQIVVIPTLVRCRPGPERKILGDLSDLGQVIGALGLGAILE